MYTSTSAAASASIACRLTAFSRRENVGWLARSAPLTGRRPHTSFSSGSPRSVSASSWSSYPQAIWYTRCRTSVARLCRTARRRHSGMQAASASHSPSARSAALTQGRPPSLVSRPASNAASSGSPTSVSKRIAGLVDSDRRGASSVDVAWTPHRYQGRRLVVTSVYVNNPG